MTANKKRLLLKSDLARCTHRQRKLFVRMYGPQEYLTDEFMFNLDKLAELHIDSIVDKMPADKLSWALQQMQNTNIGVEK